MNIEPFLNHLGKLASDPELQKMFEEEGVSLFPYNADLLDLDAGFIESKNLGVAFTFRIHREYLVELDEETYLDEFQLRGIFLFTEGVQGYKQFKGTPPQNLSFHLKREELKKMFGKPHFTRLYSSPEDGAAMEKWEFENYSMAVNFKKKTQNISFVGFSMKKPAGPLI